MEPNATRTRRSRDRRSQLAALASELFCTRGFHGVGINDIASAAGVTGPAIYRHFPDKRAILSHAVLAGLQQLEDATAAALADGPPTPERLEALLATLARLAVDQRHATALWRQEGRHLPEDDQLQARRRWSALIGHCSAALLEVRRDLPDADAELLSLACMSVYGSIAVHSTTLPKRRFEDLLAGVARAVLHAPLPADGSGPPPAAAPAAPGVLGAPRREQLLAEASRLFRERGFHDVSMEDIGTAAGIAGPSVYRHFISKAALLSAVCQRAADRLALATQHALAGVAPSDAPRALRELARSYVATLTGSPELTVSLAVGPANVPEEHRGALRRTQRDYVAQWTQLLVRVRPELAAAEARVTVHAALTVANDLARARRLSGRPALNEELAALTTAALGLDPR
jgi:AcrR family transcriptional regulator